MRRLTSLVPVALAISFAACRAGAPTEAVRPREPSAAEALGSEPTTASKDKDGKCIGVEEYGKPLVVDLKAEERGDFEAAMREGVAVVSYDCNALKLVDGCNVEGSYGYIGLSPKEELVRLQSSDELKANLPISAGAFGAKLGGELDRGMSLDIAMMIVGKRRTTRKALTRGDLVEDRSGTCKRATHFVRGATVGAFAMESGSRAKARTAAELFGIPHMGNIGLSGGSASNRETSHRDGSVEACKDASPDAQSAPGKCSAILRLELTAIDEGGKPSGSTQTAAVHAGTEDDSNDACPKGLVLADGKCTKPDSDAPHRCKPDDVTDCTAQCEKGEPASCGRLGAIYQLGKGVSPDPKRAAKLYDKACTGGWIAGCASLGALHVMGEGVARDPARGTELLQKSCDAGAVLYCDFLGKALLYGNGIPKDERRAGPLLSRGCEGGMSGSCYLVGRMAQKGQGMPEDAAKGTALMKKGCDGGDALACLGYASSFQSGTGVSKDEARAAAIYRRVCETTASDPRLAAEGCGAYGTMLAKGAGVKRDPAGAKSYVQKACKHSKDWCGQLRKAGAH